MGVDCAMPRPLRFARIANVAISAFGEMRVLIVETCKWGFPIFAVFVFT